MSHFTWVFFLPQNPPNPPVSPGKSVVDVNSNNNNVPYRNAGTVRQMLESKRNVSESAPPTFPTPVNTGNIFLIF